MTTVRACLTVVRFLMIVKNTLVRLRKLHTFSGSVPEAGIEQYTLER
jgi:hypothetical protein